jgi:ABC-type multidrug transport system fused ATPase/permease subunit
MSSASPILGYERKPPQPMTATRAYVRAMDFFREDAGKIGLSAVLIVLSSLASLLQPFPIMILLDAVLSDRRWHWAYRAFFKIAPEGNVPAQIAVLVGLTLALRLVQELLQMWQGVLKVTVGYNGLVRVRSALFGKLQELSLGYHRGRPQGDAIYRLTQATMGVHGAFTLVQGMFVNVATLLVLACLMMSLNWRLALVALSIVPLLLWAIRAYGPALSERSKRAVAADADLTSSAQRSVATVSLVQSYGREADEHRAFVALARRSAGEWWGVYWQEMKYWLAIGLIFGLGSTALFAAGGYLIYNGRMTPALLVGFLGWMGLLYDPLNKLSQSGSAFRQGAAGIERVLEVLDLEPTVRDAPDAEPLPLKSRVVQLDDVSFEYRDGEAVLRDVSATVQPGEMVAFVGPSGAGKSTLLNLLPRFFDPTKGAVRYDGVDARTVKLKDLRRHVALVLQESLILPVTVAENIAYGRPDASTDDVRRAAEMAGAHDFINRLPQKYDTVLTEGGQDLSGGQRQRIAIARALCTEAPVVVLDEPTSALDPQNEQMITETLAGLKGARTIVIVSHRLSTVADCDRIYVMEEGRIVEQGTHEALVARRGTYFRMARHQMKLEPDPTPLP